MEARRIDLWHGLWRCFPSAVVTLAVLALSFLGLTVLLSVTQNQYSDPYFIFRKQIIWFAIAIFCGACAFVSDLEKIRRYTWVIAGIAFALLVLVLIPGIGVKINGARRWIDLGPMNMQASDFVKIALVFVLAHVIATNQRYIKTFFRGFVLPCSVIGIACVLIVLQPDYGTAFHTGLVGITLLFLAGGRLFYLIPSALLALEALTLVILYNPERMDRIMSFLHVQDNKLEGAHQLWQGMLAFGAGGVYGVGLGNGRQQMAFLPESHTDFIFPIIGEELGFVFSGGVVAVFLIIFLMTLFNVRKAPNMYQFLVCVGATLLMVVQALINFGVVTGLLPTKGMSLPFISYGGSNLVCMFILVGIILNCYQRWNRRPRLNPVDL